MPGIVVFNRRWSVGSDDLVVPAVFLVVLHLIWIVVLGIILSVVDFDKYDMCVSDLHNHVLGFIVILSCCVLVEAAIAAVSMRGSILTTEPRKSMQYLLYIRLVILLVEFAWQVVGVVWLTQHFHTCTAPEAKRAVLGIVVCNWVIMLSVLISLWCTFDTAGRSWVKMKRYQESLKEREIRQGQKRRSGSRRRNWRHRKAMRAYEESWDRRCRFLFCCVKEDRHRNSFTEVAKLFTEFFRDLDVVPTDVVAGLVLMRKNQKLRRKIVVSQGNNDIYQYLSGVPVLPTTQFLCLKDPEVMADYKRVIHYMRFALAAYGWPMYMMMQPGTGLCRVIPSLRCCCCCCHKAQHTVLVDDNCCECNFVALKKLSGLKDVDIVYATYHVDIGETPFFIAVDHNEKTVVISIRGTLSVQDVLTDLKAEAEQLPVDPPKEDWLGHKGMVQAAVYILKKIKHETLLSEAFGRDLERGTQQYDLVIVGHSLGAGTASILAILMRAEFPGLQCFAYSPPGGLLSAAAVEETKSFITSVVVGKDVVPRIGLHQLEAMRQDLITRIKECSEPKWKVISSSVWCCCNKEKEAELNSGAVDAYDALQLEKDSRNFSHPSDSQIALTSHIPLFPPGRIIHIVRNHPKNSGSLCGGNEPVYQAIWVDNESLDEVIISPTMINDHMPDHVMEALEKVLSNVAPAKPIRKLPEAERKALLSQETPCSTLDRSPPHTSLCVETSFTTNQGDVEIEECNSIEYLQESGYAPSDTNSLSWDYTEGQNDVKTRTRAVDREARQEKSQSMPVSNGQPNDNFKPRPPLKLDLGSSLGDWIGEDAPLATPESLSDTSSLDSSRNSWRGSQRSGRKVVGLPRMEPILQSPLRQVKSEGYHYFMKAPSPVAYEDSPEHEQFDALSSSLNVPVAQSTPMKNTVTTKAEVSPPHRQDKRANHKLEFTGDDTYITPESSLIDTRDLLPDSMPESVFSPLVQPQDINMSSFDMTAEEQRITDKMNVLENDNNYKFAFGNDSVLSGSPYVRHSPECEHHQLVYDPQVGHYSHAGRGYPHGGYMGHCPSCEASPTSSMPKLSSPVDLLGDLNTDSCSPTVENCSVEENEKKDFKERPMRKESKDIFNPNANTIEPCLINVEDNSYTNSVQDMNLLNQQQTNNLVDSSPNHVIDMDSQQEPMSPGDKKEPIEASPVSADEDSVTNCHTALLVTESEV